MDGKVDSEGDHGDRYDELDDEPALEPDEIGEALEPDHQDAEPGAGKGHCPVRAQRDAHDDDRAHHCEHYEDAGDRALVFALQRDVDGNPPDAVVDLVSPQDFLDVAVEFFQVEDGFAGTKSDRLSPAAKFLVVCNVERQERGRDPPQDLLAQHDTPLTCGLY